MPEKNNAGKGFAVVDMRDSCQECDLGISVSHFKLNQTKQMEATTPGSICAIRRSYGVFIPGEGRTRPEWCPVRLMPEKQDLDLATCCALNFSEREIDMAEGWNACIDKLMEIPEENADWEIKQGEPDDGRKSQ